MVAAAGYLSYHTLVSPMISLQNFREVCLYREEWAEVEEEEKVGCGKI